MATITTVDGLQYSFSPKNIVVIADHDASTGEAVTCIYGITNGILKRTRAHKNSYHGSE